MYDIPSQPPVWTSEFSLLQPLDVNMTGDVLDVAIELSITIAVVDEKQRTVRALLRLHDTCFRLVTSNDQLIRELIILPVRHLELGVVPGHIWMKFHHLLVPHDL